MARSLIEIVIPTNRGGGRAIEAEPVTGQQEREDQRWTNRTESSRPRRTPRVTRDLVIFTSAIGGFWYELTIGGGRPAVLTAVTGLLLSPIMLHLDEQRRKNGRGDGSGDGGRMR